LVVLVATSVLSLDMPKLCRVCKQRYSIDVINNCRYHSGRWMGAENSKHYGTRSGGKDTGLSLFWDCCDAETPDAVGCCTGKHIGYDEDEPKGFMLKRGSS
jgi:hypothetical protein